MKATITHHNGTDTVSDFKEIEEIDEHMQTLRVFYDPDNSPEEALPITGSDLSVHHVDYHGARITSIEAEETDDTDGDGGLIEVDP